jgi:hypothetical protein
MLIALCAGRATSAMIALFAPFKPVLGRACRSGIGRSTRRTPVSSTRIVKLAQRVPALTASLRCCSYANTFVNPLPLCGFVNWYPIMRREAGAFNVYPAWEKKYKSKTKQLQKTEIVLHKLSTNPLVIKIDAQRSLVHIISNFSVFR